MFFSPSIFLFFIQVSDILLLLPSSPHQSTHPSGLQVHPQLHGALALLFSEDKEKDHLQEAEA
jgi:hypothetical protein